LSLFDNSDDVASWLYRFSRKVNAFPCEEICISTFRIVHALYILIDTNVCLVCYILLFIFLPTALRDFASCGIVHESRACLRARWDIVKYLFSCHTRIYTDDSEFFVLTGAVRGSSYRG